MAAGTYSQMHVQIVFAVKNRQRLIRSEWKGELINYIISIIVSKNVKPIIVNCMEDHIHILVGTRPSTVISELVKEIKASSTKFINSRRLSLFPFSWQDGYAVFSYSIDALPDLVNYIKNQEDHHRKINFKAEYRSLMMLNQIDFNEKYLLE